MKRLLLSLGLIMGATIGVASTQNPFSDLKPSKALLQSLEKAKAAETTPYDVKQWLAAFLRGDYQDASHLYGHVKSQLPEKLAPDAKVAYLFMLGKQGMSQTMVDEYVGLKAKGKASQSLKEFEFQIDPFMASWLVEEGVTLRPDQKAQVNEMSWEGTNRHLKGLAAIRQRTEAREALEHLEAENPLREHLLPSFIYNLMSETRYKVAEVALEMELKKGQEKGLDMSATYLLLGRLYFQMADLEKAESAYLKVSPKSDYVHEAREELLWTWLRKGDHDKLRGGIASMQLGKYQDIFAPEVFVIRAISNLKLCYFDAAKEDFGNFLTQNEMWAKRIDEATSGDSTVRPSKPDFYTEYLERGLSKRQDELKTAEALHKASIKASVPAVGKQKHWEDAESNLRARVNSLAQAVDREYRRIWQNRSVMLNEAIRKMKFVKVEVMSQVQRGNQGHPDSESSKESAADAKKKLEQEADGRRVYPFDGVVWTDEEFAVRSTANNICL